MRALLAGCLLLAACAPSGQEALVADAEEAVKQQLRDPDSAQFYEVRAYPDRKLVCGEVNAKNAFGGYVGKTLFVYHDYSAVLASDDIDAFTPKHALCLEAMDAETKAIQAETARISGNTT